MAEVPVPAKGALKVAFFSIFLDLLGFGIIIPVNSFYVEGFGASPAVVTLLGASYSAMQFLFIPFWGRLSDRIGRRPIMLLSIVISACGHFIFAFAPSLSIIFLSRMLAGFGNANIAVAQAVVSDVTSKENRAKGMGLIGVAFGLGFLLGPAIGGLLAQWGPTAPSLGAGALGVINLVMAFFLLPETNRFMNNSKTDSHHRKMISFKNFKAACAWPRMPQLLFIVFFYTTSFAMVELVIGLLLERTYVSTAAGLGTREHIQEASRLTAYFLVCVGITATIIQGGLIGRLSKRFGEVMLIRGGLFVLACAMLLMPWMSGHVKFPIFLILAFLLATGTGLYNPSSSSLVSKSVPPEVQGSVLGVYQSMSALGRVIGPSLSGFLFEWHQSFPFGFASILAFVSFGFSLLLSRLPQESL